MKFLALGIGNVMFGDEGVGVHFIQYMQQNFVFSSSQHSLEFMDGGTMANHLAPIIAEYDFVIICDCIDANDANVADVYFFDFDDIPKQIKWSGSAHEVEMLQTLQMMDIIGDRPKTKIIGVIPKRITPMSFSLSDEIHKALPIMEKIFIKELENHSFVCKQKDNISIDEIVQKWEISRN